MLSPTEIGRALVITAHPDDVDFGVAGTVAMLTDAGVEVTYCLVTDGAAGGFDHSIPRGDMASLRRIEQTLAARELGVESLVFLGHGDGRVVADLTLRRDLSRVIRQVRPTLVITQSAERDPIASTPATPTTSLPARQRCAPCTPMRATPSPTPSSSTKASTHGPSPRSGSWAADGPTPAST